MNGPSQWPDTWQVLCHEAQERPEVENSDNSLKQKVWGPGSQVLTEPSHGQVCRTKQVGGNGCRRRILGPPVSKELVPSTPFNGEFPSTAPTSCLHFLLWIMGTESSGDILEEALKYRSVDQNP